MRWLISLSPAIIFSRPNQHMRNDYLTYFEWHNCSLELAEFNAFKIIKKYWDLTQKSRLARFKALVDRFPACHHLSSLESTYAHWVLELSIELSIKLSTCIKMHIDRAHNTRQTVLRTHEESAWLNAIDKRRKSMKDDRRNDYLIVIVTSLSPITQ